MTDQGAEEDADRRRDAAKVCNSLAAFLEVVATWDFLNGDNGLAAAAARLVALGLRRTARWLRKSR